MSETTVAEQAAAPVVSESPAVIQRWEKDFSQTKTDGIIYDYIIVGSGSSGSVLANRLSEDVDKRVLLIEAGGVDTNDEIHMPLACGNCQRNQIDWQYKTVPQKHSHLNTTNQQGNWPRGKVLGGCSSINYMQYVRCDPHDYDQWNLPQWSYKEMLPYFKKLERLDTTKIPVNEEYRNHHPDKGMMDVTVLDKDDANPTSHFFIEACEKLGFRKTNDYNAEPSLIGCISMSQISTKEGKRWSTASGYLLSAVQRKNLDILIHAHTCRVVFDDERNATGVIVKRDQTVDQEEFIKGKEVILSAGSVGSPQILLLSGIGPRDELEKLGIPVIFDLPGVGKNLEDHLLAPIFYQSSIRTLSAQDLTAENLQRWAVDKRGVLTSCVIESLAWCQVVDKENKEIPELQIHFGPLTADVELMKNFNLKPDFYENHLKSIIEDEKQWTIAILPTLLHPKSKGEITLASRDPLVHPLIDPHYLEAKEDVQILVEGCKLSAKICQTEPLKNVLRPIFDPEKREENVESEDQFWERFVRNYSLTVYHPTGTCKMGEEDDQMSVVLPSTRVKGVQGLRVVDASIIPKLVSGNTNIPAIAVAERAADLIKNKH